MGRLDVPDGMIQLLEDESELAKRPRAGNQPLARSPKLHLEGLTVADFDHYREDPLEGAADVCKAASNLLKKFKRDEEKRVVGKHSLVAPIFVSRSILYVFLYLLVAHILYERKLEALTSSGEKAKKEADDQVTQADRKVQKLEGSVLKLKDEVKSFELAVSAAEKAKETAEATIRTVANNAVGVAHEQFKNALESV